MYSNAMHSINLHRHRDTIPPWHIRKQLYISNIGSHWRSAPFRIFRISHSITSILHVSFTMALQNENCQLLYVDASKWALAHPMTVGKRQRKKNLCDVHVTISYLRFMNIVNSQGISSNLVRFHSFPLSASMRLFSSLVVFFFAPIFCCWLDVSKSFQR